jgi:hypothetical protein
MKKVFINARVNYIYVIYWGLKSAAQNALNAVIGKASWCAQDFA